jgi:hypothetical protein
MIDERVDDAPPLVEIAPATGATEQTAQVAGDSSPRSAPPGRRRLGMTGGAITRLIQALWLGSGVFLMLTASAAFSAASNSTDAANIVGAVLTRWHYIALFAPLLLMFLEWRRSRPIMLVILFIAVVLASFQALLDTRIRIMRTESFAPISSLSHDDPVRRQFGMLHGLSQLFLIGQVIAAGVAVATREPAGPAA